MVHGGGRAIDADLRARGKAPRFVDGLRVTDDDTLETVVAVLAGRINTAFVAALVAAGVKAVGLTGADAALGIATLAPPLKTTTGTMADLGLVGIPRADAPARLLTDLMALGYVPVVASVGVRRGRQSAERQRRHAGGAPRVRGRREAADRRGQDRGGVRRRGRRPAMRSMRDEARAMVAAGTARDGMVAKLAACLDALIDGGVGGSADRGRPRGRLHVGAPGTTITNSGDREYH